MIRYIQTYHSIRFKRSLPNLKRIRIAAIKNIPPLYNLANPRTKTISNNKAQIPEQSISTQPKAPVSIVTDEYWKHPNRKTRPGSKLTRSPAAPPIRTETSPIRSPARFPTTNAFYPSIGPLSPEKAIVISSPNPATKKKERKERIGRAASSRSTVRINSGKKPVHRRNICHVFRVLRAHGTYGPHTSRRTPLHVHRPGRHIESTPARASTSACARANERASDLPACARTRTYRAWKCGQTPGHGVRQTDRERKRESKREREGGGE